MSTVSSLEVQIEAGTIQRIIRFGPGNAREAVWYLRCPVCEWRGELDDDQLHGRVSVCHDNCSFHETFDYAAAVRDALLKELTASQAGREEG